MNGINGRILAWTGDRQADMEIAESAIFWDKAVERTVAVKDGGLGFRLDFPDSVSMNQACATLDALHLQFELAIERLKEIESDLEECGGK